MDSTELRETIELAHLPLSEEELQALAPAFKQMLSLFDSMQDAAIPHAASQADFTGAAANAAGTSGLRQDVSQPEVRKNTGEAMLSNAPERDGNFIVIPNVL
jgi:Asp-tRNA(Asn)/Glu-tRNA(Gln) amidotransferase C subunit